jgi:hypothetical protein
MKITELRRHNLYFCIEGKKEDVQNIYPLIENYCKTQDLKFYYRKLDPISHIQIVLWESYGETVANIIGCYNRYENPIPRTLVKLARPILIRIVFLLGQPHYKNIKLLAGIE